MSIRTPEAVGGQQAGTEAGAPRPPLWVSQLLGAASEESVAVGTEGLSVTLRSSGEFSLVCVRVAAAKGLGRAETEQRAEQAYAAIADVLREQCACHPVRLWNYIPDIHRDMGEGLDRYMAFNAGRFRALAAWLGGPKAFGRRLATASGVGHGGADLVIHALAADRAGIGVENPRQVPAHQYSRQFGPLPPCFVRATALPRQGQGPLLLLGGTASVRGEESVHVGHLPAQVGETLENLASLVRRAHEVCGTAGVGGLECIGQLRVYYVRPADARWIHDAVRRAIPGADVVELVLADLCRRELLVEIEGLAVLGRC